MECLEFTQADGKSQWNYQDSSWRSTDEVCHLQVPSNTEWAVRSCDKTHHTPMHCSRCQTGQVLQYYGWWGHFSQQRTTGYLCPVCWFCKWHQRRVSAIQQTSTHNRKTHRWRNIEVSRRPMHPSWGHERSGIWWGPQYVQPTHRYSRIREKSPFATYIHCSGHCLNLVIAHSCALPEVRNVQVLDKLRTAACSSRRAPKGMAYINLLSAREWEKKQNGRHCYISVGHAGSTSQSLSTFLSSIYLLGRNAGDDCLQRAHWEAWRPVQWLGYSKLLWCSTDLCQYHQLRFHSRLNGCLPVSFSPVWNHYLAAEYYTRHHWGPFYGRQIINNVCVKHYFTFNLYRSGPKPFGMFLSLWNVCYWSCPKENSSYIFLLIQKFI